MNSTHDMVRVSTSTPCKICKAGDWCQETSDGSVAMCMRINEGAYLTKPTESGAEAHYHRLIEKPEARPVTAQPSSKRADPIKTDEVYRALLSLLPVNEQHRQNLLARKAPLPFAGNYGSLPLQGRSRVVAKLRERFPDGVLLSIPGIIRKEGDRGPYLTLAGSPGMLIAVRDVAGRIVGIKIRLDEVKPGEARYKWLSSKAAGGPGPSTPAHVPVGITVPVEVVRLTEGPLKADCAFSMSGFPTIGADSVANWRPALAIIKTLGAKMVRLAFDMDAQTNLQVGKNVMACARTIEDAGIAIEIETWPAEHKGIDDAFAAGVVPEVITGDAAHEWLAGLIPDPPEGGGDPRVNSPQGSNLEANGTATATLPERKTSTTCDQSDLGNARLLVKIHGDKMRYCHAWEKWLVWDGCRFKIDNTGAARRLAQDIADLIYRLTLSSRDAQPSDVDFAKGCSSSAKISAMLKEAAVQPGIAITPEEMDCNPWLLNCLNGTVDLRTGELRPHRQEDLLTKLCPTNFNPDAQSYNWDRFLEGIFGGSQPLIDFMLRFFGCSLSGVVTEELLLILWGCGANGKTTLLNALMETVGSDYTLKAAKDLLLAKESESHPTERADLHGKRFVACVESGNGRGLDETLVKELTGRDKIRARRMREDFWEFDPTHKVVLCTNHKPRIKGTDRGIWRRIALVPFTVTYWNPDKGETGPEELKQDKGLQDKLRAEAEGILAACVRGCVAWHKEGLRVPDEVRAATAAYRSAEDVLAAFLADCCFMADGVKEKAANLYAAFVTWAERTGETKLRQRQFGEQLGERGFHSYTNNGTWYRGIALKAENMGDAGNGN